MQRLGKQMKGTEMSVGRTCVGGACQVSRFACVSGTGCLNMKLHITEKALKALNIEPSAKKTVIFDKEQTRWLPHPVWPLRQPQAPAPGAQLPALLEKQIHAVTMIVRSSMPPLKLG